MPPDPFEHYRAGVENLLRIARDGRRDDGELERLRIGVGQWRTPQEAARILRDTAVENIGGRLIAALEAADEDEEVSPDQLEALEALIVRSQVVLEPRPLERGPQP